VTAKSLLTSLSQINYAHKTPNPARQAGKGTTNNLKGINIMPQIPQRRNNPNQIPIYRSQSNQERNDLQLSLFGEVAP
jgi:hypothetical protein